MEIKNETILTYQQLAEIVLRMKKVRIRQFFVAAIFLLNTTLFIMDWVKTGEIDMGLAFFSILILLILIRIPIRLRSTYKDITGNSDSSWSYIFKDTELECTKNDGRVKNDQATYLYESLSRLEIRKDYIILYVSKAEFLPIDKKGFSSETEMNEVISVLRSKLKN